MRDVVDAAELVLDVVRSPVANAPGIEQVVVRHGAGPHDLGPGVVVVGLRQDQRHVGDHRLQRRLDQPVGQLDVLHVGEVALHEVRDDVRGPAGHLVFGQGEGQLGVEDREARDDRSELKARLSQPSSLVMTLRLLDSLPAAGMVRMVPTGSARRRTALPVKKSQTSPSYGTPMAMALAESMTLPPPTARIKSRPFSRQSGFLPGPGSAAGWA